MSNASPPSQTKGEITPGLDIFTHTGPEERLTVNKYHLLWVIETWQKKPRGPRLEHAFIPFVVFLGLLWALLPGDFKEYWGLSADVWEAMTIILIIITGIMSVVLFIWWAVMRFKEPKKEPEQIVNDLIDQMAEDRKRLAGTTQTQETHKEGS